MATIEESQNPFTRVAQAAWEFQAWRERFIFKERRPEDHPSRIAWVTANNLWQADVAAKRHKRFF